MPEEDVYAQARKAVARQDAAALQGLFNRVSDNDVAYYNLYVSAFRAAAAPKGGSIAAIETVIKAGGPYGIADIGELYKTTVQSVFHESTRNGSKPAIRDYLFGLMKKFDDPEDLKATSTEALLFLASKVANPGRGESRVVPTIGNARFLIRNGADVDEAFGYVEDKLKRELEEPRSHRDKEVLENRMKQLQRFKRDALKG